MKEIELRNGGVAKVSDEDYPTLSKYSWTRTRIRHHVYASRIIGHNGRKLWMHREILNAASGVIVDHIDGDGLNNTRSNIRLCTSAENNRNRRAVHCGRSRFKGVCWKSNPQKWQAYIRVLGKQRYLIQTDNEVLAAIMYDEAARECFQEFAALNFPWAFQG